MIGPQIYSNIYRYNSFNKNEKKISFQYCVIALEKVYVVLTYRLNGYHNLIWITVELGKISKNNFIRDFIWNR